ncbi:MAG: hypothetical protein HFE85_05675 [Clostridiales bacterium]|nr:hypothetical protein [Clostridiales bacterium]
MDFTTYIAPELLVLVPVLYLFGALLKKSAVKDKWIPLLLGAAGVTLSAVYVLASVPVSGWNEALTATFTAVTQGILTAGASVYINQVMLQGKKEE